MGRPKESPIYILPYGIKVLYENKSTEYVMCRIEAHPLFPTSKIDPHGRQYVQRARIVMTIKLGRVLLSNEQVHHKRKRFKHRDTIANLELLTAAEHNTRHKTGTHHTEIIKKQISNSLKQLYVSGKRKRPNLRGKRNPFFGKKHTNASRRKISIARKRMFAK